MNKYNQLINTLFLMILFCSLSLNMAKKLSNKSSLALKIKQTFNTNSKIYFDGSVSKLERLDVNISCAKGALTGFRSVMNPPQNYVNQKPTHSFTYGCTSGSTGDIFGSSSPVTSGTSTSLVDMEVPNKAKTGNNPAPIGNSCSCGEGQVMRSLEFYTEEKLKNHISLRCTCVPIKANSPYECKQKVNNAFILDPNRCPTYGYRLFFHMGKLPIDLNPGVLKSLTLGYNDKSTNCNDKVCENLVIINFEYCYPKGRAPVSVDLFQTSASGTSTPRVVDPNTVPYESTIGPNITKMSANGFTKNSFSKIFFDNDKEKLPEKINASFGCKGEGALRGFDLSSRQDVKFKWGYYYSFNYGCTKGDQNDFVDASASETNGESANEVMIEVPKKDGSGNINQPIANSCTCPQGSVMKNIDFTTNADLANPYTINCSCVRAKKTLKCEKKRGNLIDLGSKCPVLGFDIYGKLQLSVSEGLNRALKSFTFAFNDTTKRCNDVFCQSLVIFQYEFCYDAETSRIEATPFGPIKDPSVAADDRFSSSRSSPSSSSFPSSSSPSSSSFPSSSFSSSSSFNSTPTKTTSVPSARQTEPVRVTTYTNPLKSGGVAQPISSNVQDILNSLLKPSSTTQSNTIIVKDPNDLPRIIMEKQQNSLNTATSGFLPQPQPQPSTTVPTVKPTTSTTTTNLRVQPTGTPTTRTVAPTTTTTPTVRTPTVPTTSQPTTSVAADSSNPNSVSAQDIATILKVHNSLRDQMATQTTSFGKAYPLAGNMRQMYWSDEIAKLAQTHANKKVFSHSDSTFRKTSQFSYLGENLYTSSTSLSTLVPDWEKAVKSWFSEIKDYNNLSQSVSKFVNIPTPMIGHFTQVIWADTYLVGCGISTYPKDINGDTFTTNLLVCIYGPGGNYLNSPIYKASDSGRQCSNGTTNSVGYKGLCCVPNKCSADDLFLN